MCSACNNHNYADKVACNRCGAARDGFLGGLPKPSSKYASMKGGGGKGRAAPYAGGAASPGQGQMRPGDWCCSKCGNHNYADKTACNKCGVLKMQSLVGGFPGAFPNMNVKEVRPGDWKCHACGNNNYASREVCNNKEFGIPKSTYISKTG